MKSDFGFKFLRIPFSTINCRNWLIFVRCLNIKPFEASTPSEEYVFDGMNGCPHDISELEKSVADAGTQLFSVAHKLHEVEQAFVDTSAEEMDDVYVMELLESMTEVKNDYQNLRKDIQEVQQLQRDVTTSIRYQMRSMHQTFRLLKKRIEVRAVQN